MHIRQTSKIIFGSLILLSIFSYVSYIYIFKATNDLLALSTSAPNGSNFDLLDLIQRNVSGIDNIVSSIAQKGYYTLSLNLSAGTDGNLTIELPRYVIDTADNIIPPVANNQSVTLIEDASANITLTGNDADFSANETLRYSIIDTPIHGKLSGKTPHVVYNPNDEYNGTDSFTFYVNDGLVNSGNVGSVNITVTPVNDSPIARDDKGIQMRILW